MLLREKVGLRPRTPKTFTSPSEKLQTRAPPGVGRALAVDLWWFLSGGFRFLEPLAPSNQQQHGSQRLRTRPQSLLTGVSGINHNGRGRDTVESGMVSEFVVLAWTTQLIRSGSGGMSRVFHIPGPTPILV